MGNGHMGNGHMGSGLYLRLDDIPLRQDARIEIIAVTADESARLRSRSQLVNNSEPAG